MWARGPYNLTSQLSCFQAQIWCEELERKVLRETAVTASKCEVVLWEVTTWVFRLGSRDKPFLPSRAARRWLDPTKDSQQVMAMAIVSSAGAALSGDNFQSCTLISLGSLSTSPIDRLFHPYRKTQDLSELLLEDAAFSDERGSVSCRNLWVSVLEECPFTLHLPPSGKSLVFCERHSWRTR